MKVLKSQLFYTLYAEGVGLDTLVYRFVTFARKLYNDIALHVYSAAFFASASSNVFIV